jgi:putative lipase involved disintegration of autophagic bodies
VKDFELYTKSLVLVDEVKGKQVRWQNLTKVWELLPKKAAFFGYVQDGVRGYLTGKS